MTHAAIAEADTPNWFRSAVSSRGSVHSTRVDGALISYRSWGDGPGEPVVLLHGGAAHSHWWDHIAPFLASNRQVIAFDLSGHGDSDHRGSYSVETWAAEAIAIARLTSSAAPILVGHSLGGVVALRAAMKHGNELGGIVIVDSPIVSFTPEENAAADRLAFGPPRFYHTKEAIVARFRPIPDQQTLDYVRDHVVATSVREGTEGWSWKFDSRIFDRAPQLPQLARLACRSALLYGALGMVSTEMAQEIFDRMGRCTALIEVPDAAHHIMLDQPIALITALRAVLATWDVDELAERDALGAE